MFGNQRPRNGGKPRFIVRAQHRDVIPRHSAGRFRRLVKSA
jgi:hypothetical protein